MLMLTTPLITKKLHFENIFSIYTLRKNVIRKMHYLFCNDK